MANTKETKYGSAVVHFIWQHTLLAAALYVMTLGVAVCVRSGLGSSVISTIPYVMECAGKIYAYIPNWSIGEYTIGMNFVFVALQIGILRREFEWVQLGQLVIGFAFGLLIDLNMALTEWLIPSTIWAKALTQIAGCTILGIGIAFEVKCGSVTMPGEGLPIAIHKVSGWEFAKAKITVDTTLVVIAVVLCYGLLGAWQWNIVGIGTLFAMVYVGIVVRGVGKRIGWFDDWVGMRFTEMGKPLKKYLFGLAKYKETRKKE